MSVFALQSVVIWKYIFKHMELEYDVLFFNVCSYFMATYDFKCKYVLICLLIRTSKKKNTLTHMNQL